ncbi:HAD family hydrolase [candidate division WOR-3 bacterium]|nr:HAD family hydrolase [candidate division WOR-3 bacterium]
MIRAVTFDFWNTLFKDTPKLAEKRRMLRIQYITEFTKLDLDTVVHHDLHHGVAEAFDFTYRLFFNTYEKEHRTFTSKELLNIILAKLNVKLSPRSFSLLKKQVEEANLAMPPIIVENIKPVLAMLPKNYKLGIVSDTGYSSGRVLRVLMKREGIFKFFSAFSFSGEAEYSKPHRTAFENVLRILNVKPRETVHIGDLEQTDIKGAKALGMKTILFIGANDKYKESTTADYVLEDYRELPELLATI